MHRLQARRLIGKSRAGSVTGAGGWWFRRLPLLVMVALVAVSVSACADQDSNRRFANEPLPTVDLASLGPTASPSLPSPVVIPPSAPALVSPEALLVARGAPKVFYVEVGPKLLAFPATGGKPQVVLDGAAEKIVSFDASPSGDRVSVLLLKDRTYSVVILDAAGKQLARRDNLDRLMRGTQVTPAKSGPAGTDLINWSPQGDQLLVAFATGGIVTVPLRGDPVVLLSPKDAPGPIDAAWSPAGDAIAYVNRASVESSAGLYLASTRPGTPRVLVPPEPGSGPSVRRLAWYPSGKSILYTRASSTNGLPIGGDLFQISPLGGGSTIVASAGRVAPISSIVEFTPSPDGRAIAYTIVVPGPNGPAFNSLWIQQLGTSNRQRLSTPAGIAVNELWWVSSGLVWRATTDSTAVVATDQNESFTLYQTAKGGVVTPIYQFRGPVATPVASPVASPQASPVASPGAMASPIASPAGGKATPGAATPHAATPARSTPAR